MGEKRVTQQTASDEIYNDDWFLKDSILYGTKKVQPSVIKEYVNQGMATSQDLADEATARQNMDSQLASGISKQMSNLADFYDTTTSYVVGDVCVLQSGELMRCIAPTSGTFDNTKWEEVTVDDLIDEIDLSAEAISYDNLTTGLMATNVQGAIDEIDGTVDQIGSDVDTLKTDVDNLETAMETKAEIDGIYEDLIAGNLLSDSYTADSAPYLYRQSPSASSVEQNIIGGTVAWNQIYNYTVDGESNGVRVLVQNGVVTISGTSSSTGSGRPLAWTDFKATIGHKYIYLADFELPNGSYIMDQYNINSTTNAIGKVFNCIAGYLIPQLRIAEENTTFNISNKHLSIIDLTQMFGTTIADAVYTMEQATAGSGIAWLKSYGFLTKDYYAYDSGSLQSVKTSGRKIVGKNLFDENSVTENKGLNQTGGLFNSDIYAVSDFIMIPPNTTFYLSNVAGSSSGVTSCFYDSNKEFISTAFIYGGGGQFVSGNVTSPSNATYMRVGTNTNNYKGVTVVSIGSTATSYEPYTTHTYPTSPIDLRGLFKLSNGNLVADGDVYSADGGVKRRYDDVDLGSLTWTYEDSETPKRFRASLPTVPKLSGLVVCSKYLGTQKGAGALDDKELCISGTQAYPFLRIRDDSITDATVFKNAVNGQKLVYELATPTTESADAYENPQLVGSTEEFIDTRDVPIPVGGERKYHTDLKAKLEELAKIPDVPSVNGTYKLIATRSASGVTYSWESN
ncbi:MAG: hypothetical protein J6S67_00110 [Methanobrevibacter sp.]|nr:hypothetical protein [Methanobrevibacter sp.]